MQKIMQLLEPFGSPYSDIAAVAIMFSLLFVLVYLITLLFDKKKVEPLKEDMEEDAPADTVPVQTQPDTIPSPPEPKTEQGTESEFTSSVKPSESVSKTPVTQTRSESVDKSPSEDIPDGFKPFATEKKDKSSVSEKAPEQKPVFDSAPVRKEGEAVEEPKESFFNRLKSGLSKTQQGLFGRLGNVFSGGTIDEETWDEFEEVLITSDIGMATTMKLRESLSSKLNSGNTADIEGLKSVLKGEVLEILKKAEADHAMADHKPYVLMVAGVNGVGKTTTIGKLANMFTTEGKNVMVAAADTFRAAAVEQLEVWANRVGSDFLKGSMGADPSSVAFDAVEASVARGIDVLIVDTAGRLHTKSNLMDELKKLRRVIGKALEGAPHETLLVLDATTGQNAVQQAKLFNESIEVSGIVLTKLDGTAKGGVIITIADELNIPVKYIGVGEGLNDLRDFKAEEFVEALFMTEQVVH